MVDRDNRDANPMVAMQLRLPLSTHAALRKRAEAEHRSMHAQLLHILEEALGVGGKAK